MALKSHIKPLSHVLLYTPPYSNVISMLKSKKREIKSAELFFSGHR